MNFKQLIILLFTTFSLPCLGSLEEMTLEEKIGQLLMVHFNGEQVNDDAKFLVQEIKVGGIIYYNWANGLSSPEQIQSLSTGLQKLTEANQPSIPLLIATDQEGGIVCRLKEGFTIFPGNRAIGETSNPILAEEAALAMGKELLAVGINMNLAPVVDINSNPRNPVIGLRSFGEGAQTVVAFGEKALNGYRQARVIATLKHFPGYGDVSVDPHNDLPVVHKSKEELDQVDLLPFAKLATSAEAIMTAHILVPALDPENCSTLSPKTLSYLRENIGFQGVVISDSLLMEGVIKKCHTVDEAAIQALNAGCDILILGGKILEGQEAGLELNPQQIQHIHRSLIEAVRTGRISKRRVDEAVNRILNLKNRYLISKNEELQSDFSKTICTEAHRSIAQKIASFALKTIKHPSGLAPTFSEKNISIFAPQMLQNNINQTTLLKIGKSTNSFFFRTLCPSQDEIERAKQHAKSAEILFICSYNAWKNPSQIALIQSLLKTGKPAVLLVMGDPVDASLFLKANLIFKTFSPTPPSIQAICDQLEKERCMAPNCDGVDLR